MTATSQLTDTPDPAIDDQAACCDIACLSIAKFGPSKPGFAGLVNRCLIMTLVMVAAVGILIVLAKAGVVIPGLSVGYMIATGLCIWKAMMLGLFFGAYPPGNDNAMIRLGLATFCRTGIPLLVVLVGLDYATRPDSATRFLLAIYMVGFFSSLTLEVCKLSGSDVPLQQPARG